MKAMKALNVYKLFGEHIDKAFELLKAGASREHLAKKFKTTAAVIDVSLEIEEGEIFVLMGLSGSGKSTFVRCLNLLHKPTSGTVEVFGQDIGSLSPKELRQLRSEKISMVFQNFGLLPHRTVYENALWGLSLRHLDKETEKQKVERALELVGLLEWRDHYPDELSGGMKQRVGLARALAADTDIILMDEAFSALDPLIRSEMQGELLSLQKELNKTIVFITHDLNEAMRLGNRIAVLRDGRLIQVGTPEEILQNPADDYVEAFIENVDRSRILTAENAMITPDNRYVIGEDLRLALRRMSQQEANYLYVVDQDQRLLGYINGDRALAAVQAGKKTVDQQLYKDFKTVLPDATLGDCLSEAITSTAPLAVVSEDGQFMGLVPRVAILAALDSNDYPDLDAMGSVASIRSEIPSGKHLVGSLESASTSSDTNNCTEQPLSTTKANQGEHV